MFHIFTIEGLRPNVSLEKILHHPYRVERKTDGSRVRRFEEYVRDSLSSKPGFGQSGVAAYDSASREVSLPRSEPIIHAHQIMSSPVVTLPPDVAITDAWEIFRYHRLRYMPVLDMENITGMLSDRDIFCSLVEENGRIVSREGKSVKDIMVKEVITSDMATDIRRIALVMFHRHIGAMPVVKPDGRLAGIITRSDILHALVSHSSMDMTV